MKKLINLRDYEINQHLTKNNQLEKNKIKNYDKIIKQLNSSKIKTVNVKTKVEESCQRNNKKHQTMKQIINRKNSPLIKSIKLSTKKGSCSNLSYLILMNQAQKKQHFNSTKANSRSNIKSSYITKQQQYDVNNSEEYLSNIRQSIIIGLKNKNMKLLSQYKYKQTPCEDLQQRKSNDEYLQQKQFKKIEFIKSHNYAPTQQNYLDFSFQNQQQQVDSIQQTKKTNQNQKYETFQMTSPLMISYQKSSKYGQVLCSSINSNKNNINKKQAILQKDKNMKASVKSQQRIQKYKKDTTQKLCQKNKYQFANNKNISIQNLNIHLNDKTIDNNNKKKRKRVVSYSEYLKILDYGTKMNHSQNKKKQNSLNQQNKLVSNKNSKNNKIMTGVNNVNSNIIKVNDNLQNKNKKNKVIKKQIMLSLIRNHSSISKHSLQKTKNDHKECLQIRKNKQYKQKNSSKLKTGKSYLYRNNSSINHIDQYTYNTSNSNSNTQTKINIMNKQNNKFSSQYNQTNNLSSQYHQLNNHFLSSNYEQQQLSLSNKKQNIISYFSKKNQQNCINSHKTSKMSNPKKYCQFQFYKSDEQNQNQNIGQLTLQTVQSNRKKNNRYKNKYNKQINKYSKQIYNDDQKNNKNVQLFQSNSYQMINLSNIDQLLNSKAYQKIQKKKKRPRKISLKQFKQSYVNQNKRYQQIKANNVNQIPLQNEFSGPISMIELNTRRQTPFKYQDQQQYSKLQTTNENIIDNKMKILYLKTLQVLNRYEKQLKQAKAEIKHLKNKQKINNFNVYDKYRKTQQTRREAYKKK